jgi:2-phosphosulfolactate phosphatase
MQPTVEISFSPLLYPSKITAGKFITVVTDIFRATTSIISAMDYGVESIIPVKGVDDAKKMKAEGYLVACERDGKLLDFADIGNSPSDFWKPELKRKTIAFSTTNGTQAINLAKEDALDVLIGGFINLQPLADVLLQRNENVVVLCAAWKNLFNLEDTLFAGALAEILMQQNFITHCDSCKAAMHLWSGAKNNLQDYLSSSSHRQRLAHIMSQADFEYSIQLNQCQNVPVLRDSKLINL